MASLGTVIALMGTPLHPSVKGLGDVEIGYEVRGC